MIRNLLVISISAAALSSCIISSENLVPDMPHNSMWRQRAQQEALAARAHLPADKQAAVPVTPTATAVEPVVASTVPTSVTPKPVAVTPKPAAPVKTAAAKPAGNHITQATSTSPVTTPATPAIKPEPVPVAITPQPVPVDTPAVKPVVTPAAPTQAAANTTATPAPKKDNSHIPYAKRVPGDPTRVYNPLAPDLTIRTINPATGEPLPKDTVLRVRGTDREFRVPAW